MEQVYNESIKSVGVDVTSEFEDGEMDAADLAEFGGDEYNPDDFVVDSRPEKFEKKKMHEHMFKNPWALGKETFAKTDVVHIRSEEARIRKQKSDLRRCMLDNIQKEELAEKQDVVVSMDMEGEVPYGKG